MSDWTNIKDCPLCGSEDSMNCGVDTYIFDSVWGLCLACGFNYNVRCSRLSLEDLNEERAPELTPLKSREKLGDGLPAYELVTPK